MRRFIRRSTHKGLVSIFIILFSFASVAVPICSGSNGNSALIVIDMQPKFVTRGGNDQTPANKAKVDQIIKEQVAAINRAKEANIPIVFLEYEGDYGDTNDTLRAAVGNYKDAKFFKKNSDGMFEDYNKHKKDLADYLTRKQVGTLIITGANGGACVLQSIRGALGNNCTVIAFSKGIADFNYKDFIYPYVGQYSNIKPNCKDCMFKEVSSIDGVTQFMVNNSSRGSPASSNESRGVR